MRGYARRSRVLWETARLTAYCSAHCMGSKTIPPPPEKWLPFSWERNKPSQQEIDDLKALADKYMKNGGS